MRTFRRLRYARGCAIKHTESGAELGWHVRTRRVRTRLLSAALTTRLSVRSMLGRARALTSRSARAASRTQTRASRRRAARPEKGRRESLSLRRPRSYPGSVRSRPWPHRGGRARAQLETHDGGHIAARVLRVRRALHGRGRAAHVHGAERHGARGDQREHARVGDAARHIVDQRGACVETGARHLGGWMKMKRNA